MEKPDLDDLIEEEINKQGIVCDYWDNVGDCCGAIALVLDGSNVKRPCDIPTDAWDRAIDKIIQQEILSDRQYYLVNLTQNQLGWIPHLRRHGFRIVAKQLNGGSGNTIYVLIKSNLTGTKINAR